MKYSKNLVNSPVSRHCILGKVGRLEGLDVGMLECWKVEMLEGWKIGRLEGSSDEEVLSFPKVIIPDRAERRRREATLYFGNGWKIRRSEGWKIGRLECWKIGRLEGSSNEGVLSFPQVIIPDRAELRRCEARRV